MYISPLSSTIVGVKSYHYTPLGHHYDYSTERYVCIILSMQSQTWSMTSSISLQHVFCTTGAHIATVGVSTKLAARSWNCALVCVCVTWQSCSNHMTNALYHMILTNTPGSIDTANVVSLRAWAETAITGAETTALAPAIVNRASISNRRSVWVQITKNYIIVRVDICKLYTC